MDEQTHTFASRHGTLILGPKGLTIKRTWSQALQSGRLASRSQTIPYDALKDVSQKHISNTKGYLQLTTKPGTANSSPLNRHTRLNFDYRQSHQFRQAQRIIEERLRLLEEEENQESPRGGEPKPPQEEAKDLNRPSSLPFRR